MATAWLLLLVAVIVFAGGALAKQIFFLDLQRSLLVSAETVAPLIDPAALDRFRARADESTPEYLANLKPLRALMRANSDVRFAFVGVAVTGDSM